MFTGCPLARPRRNRCLGSALPAWACHPHQLKTLRVRAASQSAAAAAAAALTPGAADPGSYAAAPTPAAGCSLGRDFESNPNPSDMCQRPPKSLFLKPPDRARGHWPLPWEPPSHRGGARGEVRSQHLPPCTVPRLEGLCGRGLGGRRRPLRAAPGLLVARARPPVATAAAAPAPREGPDAENWRGRGEASCGCWALCCCDWCPGLSHHQ